MYTKIIIAMLLTLGILAFPITIFGFSAYGMLLFRIGKASLFCAIMYVMIKRLGSNSNYPLQDSLTFSTFKHLFPATVALLLYIVFYHQKIFGHGVTEVSNILVIIISTFFAATGEEFVFRGYIYYVLRKYGNPLIKSILISTILFALTHSISFTRHGDIWSTINQIGFAMGMGLVLSAIFIISKNIWLAGIFHTIVNLPSAFSKFTEIESIAIVTEQPVSFWENVLSSLLYLLVISPAFLLGGYYLQQVRKIETERITFANNISRKDEGS